MDYSAFPTMDSIVQHHLGTMHSHQASPAFELDDEELRKYLASPQSASAPTPQEQQQQQHRGSNQCTMEQTSTASMPTDGNLAAAAAASSGVPAGSLESALAALGETGRQQLLAILQLANNPQAGGISTTSSDPSDGRSSNVLHMAAGPSGPAHHSRSGSLSALAAAEAGGAEPQTRAAATSSSNPSMTAQDGGLLQQAMAQQMQIQMALQLQRQQLAQPHRDSSALLAQQFALPGHTISSSASSSASPSSSAQHQYQQHAAHFPAHPQHQHPQQQQVSSSVPPTPAAAGGYSGSFGGSGGSGNGHGPSSVPPSPASFANAFNHYASGRQHGNGHGYGHGQGTGVASAAGVGRHGSSSNKDGSTPSSGSSKPSPALSAVTSYSNPTSSKQPAGPRHSAQRQGSGSAGGGGGDGGGRSTKYSSSSSSGYGHGNGNGSSANAMLDNLSFTLPDANYYRSPAVAPGTSSSAFYTESNLGDESDLLFTPLLSPALTASTHPGPSVGPLPETFANLGKDFGPPSGQPMDGQHPGSTVVSPLNFFSPLTSPALRPQTHAQVQGDGSQSQPQPQHIRSTVASPRTFTSGQSTRPSTLKGASKNAPKTRPSPIIRPTDVSSGTFSKPSSKRHTPSTSVSSSAAAPGIHSGMTTNGMSPNTVTSTNLNASANSYSQPVSQSSSYASLLNNLARIHEHAAQEALQDSPSPQQFDLSSAPSAAAFFGSLTGQATASNPHGFAREQQRLPSGMKPTEEGSGSPYKQESQPNSNIPSPLDLNSFFGMLGGVATSGAVGPAVVAEPEAAQTDQMRVDSAPQSASASASETEQGKAQTSTFDFNDYSSFFQNPANTAQALTNPLAHFLLANSAGNSTVSGAGGASTTMNSGSAPLTPASFMNLPQNQYNLLTGLLADHGQKPQLAHQAQPNVSSGTTPQPQSKPPSAGPSPRTRPQGQGPATEGTTTAATMKGQRSQPHSVQQSPQILPTYRDGARGLKVPISPALLAQNITEVAAAAIAAKEAKSAAKGRGSGRKRAQSSTVNKESGQTNGEAIASTSAAGPPVRKTGKRAAAQAAESAVQASVKEDEAADDAHAMALDASSSTAMPGSGARTALPSAEQSPVLAAAPPETRKSSHKVAEQRRRDSLKLCFEELRFILPPINPEEDEDFNGGKRPGENNVGGQRGRSQNVDPAHPNRGISKVALLRKSNEYVTKLHERIDKRDRAIETLRAELRLCRATLGHAPAGDIVSLDALSAVDWEELDEDHDPVPPTYILHGLCPPGSTLVYRPSHATIPEETASMNEDTRDGQDDESEQEEDEDEYRVKKGKVKRNGSTARRKSGVKA